MPDAVWQLRPQVNIAFEAKSQADANAPISVATARQCVGHVGTTREIHSLGKNEPCTVVLLCHQPSINKDAVPQVGDTKIFLIRDVRDLAEEVANTLRRIRAKAEEGTELVELVQREYARSRLDPRSVVERLTRNAAMDLERVG
jgi:hypothetical protein